MSKETPRLGGSLIVRKGEAAPMTAGATAAVAAAPVEPPKNDPPAAAPRATKAAIPRGIAGTTAVTVRLDPDRYERLKLHGFKQRQTNQEILVAALDDYLATKPTVT